MIKASVIIPVHNCCSETGGNKGKRLRRCLDSLCSQTMDDEEYEIILVDDSSVDGSDLICEEYASSRDNISFIRLDPALHTGSPSPPRNEGIRHARGEYLVFGDADDWFGPDCLKRLIGHAVEDGSDFVIGRVLTVDRAKMVGRVAWCRSECPGIQGRNPADTPEFYETIGSWGRAVKRELIENNGIYFVDNAYLFEDLIWISRVFYHAINPSIANDYNYYYLRRDRDVPTLSSAQGLTPSNKPENFCRTIDLLVSTIESFGYDERHVIWRKLFSYVVPVAFDYVNQAAAIAPESYPNGGQEWKQRIWDRVRCHYNPQVRMHNALGQICQSDAIDAGYGFDFNEDSLRFYADIVVPAETESKALSVLEGSDIAFPELPSYLSEEAKGRLIARQAASYAFYGIVEKQRSSTVVSGEYAVPLKVSSVFSVTAKAAGTEDECVAELVMEPFAWGEDYQEYGTWTATFEGVSLDRPQDIEFEIALDKSVLARVKGKEWSSVLGRPETPNWKRVMSARLERADAQLERARAEVGETSARLECAQVEIDDMRVKLDEAQSEAARLKGDLDRAKSEAAAAKAAFAKVVGSRSWRFTKPFR